MRRHFATPIVALACAALAAAGVVWLTRVPFADWSDADSTSRLRDFPPGFPSAIAAGMALGASTEQSARWVMILAARLGYHAVVRADQAVVWVK